LLRTCPHDAVAVPDSLPMYVAVLPALPVPVMVALALRPVTVQVPGPHGMLLKTTEVPLLVDWIQIVWVPEAVKVQREVTVPLLVRVAV